VAAAPRCPTFQSRSVSELFVQMFAMRLESRQRREVVEYERRARDISDQLLGAVASDETLLKDPDLACRHPHQCHSGRRCWRLGQRKLRVLRHDAADRFLPSSSARSQRHGRGSSVRDGSGLHATQGRRRACSDKRWNPRHSNIAFATGLRRAVQIRARQAGDLGWRSAQAR
jgi:hypothetical protein